MRRIFLLSMFLVGFLFLSFGLIRAQGGMMSDSDESGLDASESADGHEMTVEAVLQRILAQQQVETVQQLDLTKVGEDEWERLGDAVMELQHPREAHEMMDRMMGGEGSESLRQMHISMGRAYLGYNDGTYGPGAMMGRGMTPLRQGYEGQVGSWNTSRDEKGGVNNMMGFGSMMGSGGFSNASGLFAGITWIALIIFLGAGAYYFIKKAGKK